MANIPIISFNSGELSPLIDARSDIEKYSSGCRTLQNMIPRIYGNVERRPGTEYIASSKDASLTAKLVPFIYSDTISYQMEFGPEYIRFYYNGAQVVGVAEPDDVHYDEFHHTNWITSFDYIMGDFVTHGGTIYRCLVAHTSEDDGDHDDPASNFTDWVEADLDSNDYPICETPTPYKADDLFELQFRQIADVIRITHNNYAPRILTRTSVYTFDLATIDFTKGPFMKRNDLANDDDVTLTPSAVTGDITITASSAVFNSFHVNAPGALFKITQPRLTTKTSGSIEATGVIGSEIPIKGVFTLNIHGQWEATVDLERNVNNEGWEIYRTYVSTKDKHVAQTFTEEEDNVKYRINCISYDAGPVEADITLEESTQSGIARITGYTSPTEVTAKVLVDFAYRAAEDLGLTGATAFSKITDTNIDTWYEASPHANDNDRTTKVGFDGTHGGVVIGIYKVELSLSVDSRVTGIEYYRHWRLSSYKPVGYEKISVYYGGAWHLVKTINYTQEGIGTGLVKVTDGAPWSDVSKIKIEAKMSADRITAGQAAASHHLYELTVWAVAETDVDAEGLPANPSKRWFEGAWSAHRGYPAALAFFEERSVYGGTVHQPQTVWLSESGNYDYFEEGIKKSDSFWLTLAADKRNGIRWMSALEALVLGTNGGEWRIRAKANDEEITPTNYNARQQTAYGSKRIQPLQVGDAILFVDSVGRKMREMTYSDAKLKYISPDLSALAEHITLSGITCIAHQKNPDSIIWFTLDNGKLLSMTYERDQNVVAWANHIIGGTNVVVESVSVILGDDEDEVWISVARTVDDNTARTIEQLQPRVDVDLEDAWFLDSGLGFEGELVDITGVTDNGDGTTTITADNDFEDGDIVYIDGIVGPDELNDRYFVVTDPTDDDFIIRTYQRTSASPSYSGSSSISPSASVSPSASPTGPT
jgi:hypothetical protein